MLAAKSKLVLLGAALGSAFLMLVVGPLNALAGEGNSNYMGALSSTAPSGYTPSPVSYKPGATLAFQFTVTNLTAEQQSMSLQLNVNHILTYRGVDVSDGQPGVSSGAVVDGQFDDTQSTQAQDSSPTFTAFTIGPNASETVNMSRHLTAACGYYQVDVAKTGMMSQKGLVGFEIRVLGCGAPVIAPSPSPAGGGVGAGSTPTPSPTPEVTPSPSPAGGGVGAGSTPSPPGTGSVLGTTATGHGDVLAATGSTSPLEVISLTLLVFGALVVITGLAWRRRET